MPFISVSKESEVKKIISNNRKVVVMYGASWCHGCTKAKPLMKKKSNSVSYPIVYVDVDKCGVVTDTIPAFAFIESGKRISYIEGDIEKVLSMCGTFGLVEESVKEDRVYVKEDKEKRSHRDVKDKEMKDVKVNEKKEKRSHRDVKEKKDKRHCRCH